MGTAPRVRRLVLVPALALAAVAGLTAACSANSLPSGTGDPGNQRLNALATDRVVNTYPAGSQPSGTLYTQPAKWDTSYHYWGSPMVARNFTSHLTLQRVYAFYGHLAAADGWVATSRSPLGLVWNWQKTFPGGYSARLHLAEPNVARSSAEVSDEPYQLIESADPITKS